ncbi:MAG TPA: hypothetical protein VMP01_20915 [Pirellulaceae bacterium]|nr:hypothetical protein [Pirellulaceae bacterium]
MPTLSDLRNRTFNTRPRLAQVVSEEEAMVTDQRSRLRPTQIVDQKLRTALNRSHVPRESTSVATDSVA